MTGWRYEDDEFDTAVLGMQCGRIAWTDGTNRPLDMVMAKEAATDDFLTAKADSEHLWTLLDAGFVYITANVTYERPLGCGATFDDIRPIPESQHDAACHLASTLFTRDRYHTDPRIPTETANHAKAQWLRNCLSGKRQSCVMGAFHKQTLVGFCASMLADHGPAIDLIGLDPGARGYGYGTKLLLNAMWQYEDHGTVFRAGTQLVNTGARRLYESLDFRVVNRQHVLHWRRE